MTADAKLPLPQAEETLSSGEGPGEFLIHRNPTFVVYLDKDSDLEWEAKDEVMAKFESGEIGKILRQVAALNSIPVNHLPLESKRALRRMLGEAMAIAFMEDVANSGKLVEDANKFLAARNRDISRSWFLLSGVVLTALVVLIAVVLWCFRKELRVSLGETFVSLAIVSTGGAIGTLGSIIQRIPKVNLDPVSGFTLHALEAVGRIILGLIFGAIAFLAVKNGLIVPKLANAGLVGLFLLGIIAGINERWIPSFISSFNTSDKRQR
jgi:hypothetical protein